MFPSLITSCDHPIHDLIQPPSNIGKKTNSSPSLRSASGRSYGFTREPFRTTMMLAPISSRIVFQEPPFSAARRRTIPRIDSPSGTETQISPEPGSAMFKFWHIHRLIFNFTMGMGVASLLSSHTLEARRHPDLPVSQHASRSGISFSNPRALRVCGNGLPVTGSQPISSK